MVNSAGVLRWCSMKMLSDWPFSDVVLSLDIISSIIVLGLKASEW